MPTYDLKCTNSECGTVKEVSLRISDALPDCSVCGQPTEKVWTQSSAKYFEDAIPGGLVLHNLGPTPVTVYSHSERLALAKSRGLEERIEHVPYKEMGDKSPFTISWASGPPPGVDPRPISMLSPEEQEARHREWLATEPFDSPLLKK